MNIFNPLIKEQDGMIQPKMALHSPKQVLNQINYENPFQQRSKTPMAKFNAYDPRRIN